MNHFVQISSRISLRISLGDILKNETAEWEGMEILPPHFPSEKPFLQEHSLALTSGRWHYYALLWFVLALSSSSCFSSPLVIWEICLHILCLRIIEEKVLAESFWACRSSGIFNWHKFPVEVMEILNWLLNICISFGCCNKKKWPSSPYTQTSNPFQLSL